MKISPKALCQYVASILNFLGIGNRYIFRNSVLQAERQEFPFIRDKCTLVIRPSFYIDFDKTHFPFRAEQFYVHHISSVKYEWLYQDLGGQI